MNTNNWNYSTDKQLVDKSLRGDPHAFPVIIKNTERLVAQIVFKMIPNPEDRKDIAQDIYLKAYKNLATFRFQSKLSTWIAQISYHTCMDFLEKKKLVLPGDHTPDADTDDVFEAHTLHGEITGMMRRKELSGILKTAIDKLSPVYKTLVTLYHNEEVSYEEIAQITGLPAGTIKSYLFRARKELRNSLLATYKKEEL